ncbi:MAG: phospholipid carrier-dependent glycosyltransferase [Planctomycetes bacterium]|nr:phospholipid carrier-dependent glycosyltransferase [Planctomycetota bacterium]MBM4078203.1 phospholipid carrier-dependent glycosyltransferase [Planctomycetota bacterium]MBM4083338.1 phospholipid carrier-dependent glycosyltransferase [Planctomycetota bacterium]
MDSHRHGHSVLGSLSRTETSERSVVADAAPAREPVPPVVKSSWGYTVLALVLAALALRLFLTRYQWCMDSDEIAYVAIAQGGVAGKGYFNDIFPPLYPMLIGWASRLVGDLEKGGRLVSAVCGALLVLPVFLLARRVFDRQIALTAAALVVVYPILTEYSTYVMTESAFALLLVTAVLTFVIVLAGGGVGFSLITGVLLGAAALLRPEAAAFVALFAVALLAAAAFGPARLPAPWLALGLLLLGFALPTFPYARYLKKTTGHWALSGKAELMLARAEAVGDPYPIWATDKFWTGTSPETRKKGLAEQVLSDPLKSAKIWLMNLHLMDKYAIPGLFPPLMIFMIGLGLLRTNLSLSSGLPEWLLLACLAPYLVVLFFQADARIFSPLVPIALMWAARGVQSAQQALDANLRARSWPVRNVLLIFIALSLLPYTLRPLYRGDMRKIYRDVGVWLKEHQPAPLRVADRKNYVAHYAGAEFVMLPLGDYDQILAFCRKRQATHMVVDTKLVAVVRPQLAFLLDPKHAPSELEFVREFRDRYETLLVLYRVRAQET